MRKVVLIVVALFVITGCGNTKEFGNLVEKASQHYERSEFESALTVYEKALDLKEDVEVRRKYEDTKKELAAATLYANFRTALESAVTDLENIRDRKSLVELADNVLEATNTLVKAKVDGSLRSSIDIKKAQKETLSISMIESRARLADIPEALGKDYYTYAVDLKESIEDLLKRIY
ncbi:hypothetical protein [Paenibacillus sp. NPDC057967]|uniref:hypothetical protein n=1 Tax=Paenibacillus sp. NPDC057967 TaxID=3346293 RepID=UPI0036DF7E7E